MAVRYYKEKMRLNASHSFSYPNGVHRHTFDMTFWLIKENKEFISYNMIEQSIWIFLSNFSGKVLNTVSPFDRIVPTIENIGDVFFENVGTIMENHGFKLAGLEINETPSAAFSILEGSRQNHLPSAGKNFTGAVS